MTTENANLQLKNEFPFSKNDFNNLRGILSHHSGIELQDGKMQLMYSRLVRRVRKLELSNFSEYHELLKNLLSKGDDAELMVMINAMTTNVTHFFREQHHFDYLEENLQNMLDKFGKVRIWSAAASIGAEPWSIAMVVDKFKVTNPHADIKIIATDIDSSVIETCKKGIYELNPETVKSHLYMNKYLKRITIENKTPSMFNHLYYKIDERLKSHIEFKKLNLLHNWESCIEKHYHFIFCRNVIIYFNKDTQRTLFEKISKKMPEKSILFLGHSESLVGVSTNFITHGYTTYERKKDV